ncbi:hypothetical protein MTO96_018046 [Rhipicephalus appendiculatus]
MSSLLEPCDGSTREARVNDLDNAVEAANLDLADRILQKIPSDHAEYVEQKKEDFILQQDRSPVHTSKLATAFLQQRGVAVLEWSPQSVDMNIIENIWGNIKVALCSRSLHGLSSDNLWSAVQECWEEARENTELRDALRTLYDKRVHAYTEDTMAEATSYAKDSAQGSWSRILEILEQDPKQDPRDPGAKAPGSRGELLRAAQRHRFPQQYFKRERAM